MFTQLREKLEKPLNASLSCPKIVQINCLSAINSSCLPPKLRNSSFITTHEHCSLIISFHPHAIIVNKRILWSWDVCLYITRLYDGQAKQTWPAVALIHNSMIKALISSNYPCLCVLQGVIVRCYDERTSLRWILSRVWVRESKLGHKDVWFLPQMKANWTSLCVFVSFFTNGDDEVIYCCFIS